MVRYAGLYAHCVKRRWLEIANAALETLRSQIPLFALDPLLKSVAPLKWRERIKASFGYDPLACPRYGRIMELAEIWEPKRGFVWMKRWLETHRVRKAARDAIKRLRRSNNPAVQNHFPNISSFRSPPKQLSISVGTHPEYLMCLLAFPSAKSGFALRTMTP